MSESALVSTQPVLLALGDAAWTVQFGASIDPDIHARVMGLAQSLAQARQEDPLLSTISDVVPTFRSLTVHFSPQDTDSERLGQRLLALAEAAPQATLAGRTWRLPACFDPRFAPDLAALAQAKAMDERQVVDQLLGCSFKVYMIGFLPGFPYMGGLPSQLAMPRLATPRARVPAQSIAVAGQMCAVYPWDSPGGWNLLGRTPLSLFDLRHNEQPAMLVAGDTVRWYEVSFSEYEALFQQCARGALPREAFLIAESCT